MSVLVAANTQATSTEESNSSDEKSTTLQCCWLKAFARASRREVLVMVFAVACAKDTVCFCWAVVTLVLVVAR